MIHGVINVLINNNNNNKYLFVARVLNVHKVLHTKLMLYIFCFPYRKIMNIISSLGSSKVHLVGSRAMSHNHAYKPSENHYLLDTW